MNDIDTKFISDTPELLSILYDLDLLPEQIKEGSRDWEILHLIVILWKSKKPEDLILSS